MKRFFFLFLALILSLCIGIAIADDASDFFFIQIADTQLGMTSGSKDMTAEIENFNRAVEHINRLKPAFVIISGDMINADLNPTQIRAFWKIARKISPSIRLYLVPGNHDVGKANEGNIHFYIKYFGKDHYSFSYKGTDFIVLNSCLIQDADGDENLRTTQREWFESELEAAKKRNPNHIFVCTHHAWFLKDINENDTYFNIPKPERDVYIALMKRFGVDYALAGHLHDESKAKYGSLTMITTSSLGKALGQTPVGFRVFNVYKDRVEHKYYPLDKVPER